MQYLYFAITNSNMVYCYIDIINCVTVQNDQEVQSQGVQWRCPSASANGTPLVRRDEMRHGFFYFLG